MLIPAYRWGATARAYRAVPIGLCVGLLLLLVLQWLLLTIPTISAESFNEGAVEVKRSNHWRYGYVAGRHGAFPVKAPLGANAAPFVPPANDGLAALIAHNMKTAPWKAGLEVGLYLGLFALGRFSFGYLRLARCVTESRGRWSWGMALLTVGLVTAGMAPYLAAGYGEPLFSTRRGLAALSYSALLPMTAPVTPAVSYGLLLQSVTIWPLAATEWAAGPLWDVLGIRSALWLVTVGFWGVLVATYAWFVRFPVDPPLD